MDFIEREKKKKKIFFLWILLSIQVESFDFILLARLRKIQKSIEIVIKYIFLFIWEIVFHLFKDLFVALLSKLIWSGLFIINNIINWSRVVTTESSVVIYKQNDSILLKLNFDNECFDFIFSWLPNCQIATEPALYPLFWNSMWYYFKKIKTTHKLL